MKTTEKLPTNKTITREPFPNSKKVYVSGTIYPDIKVAMREIEVSSGISSKSGNGKSKETIRVYDTSGPFTEPSIDIDVEKGIPRLRAQWKFQRSGKNISQMHYAKKGIITPEMEYVAIRENVTVEFVRDEVARGRAIIPSNINHPEELGRAS